MLLALEIVVNAFSQGTGSLTMDDANGFEMSQISIIKIFVEFSNSLIHGFTKKVDFGRNAGGFGHTDLSGSCAGKRRCCNYRFINKFQVRNMNLGAYDAHLHKKITFGIRTGTDRTFKIHAEYPNGITRTYIFGREFLFRLLFDGGLCHFLFSLIEALAKLLAFSFNSGSIYIFIMEFVEKLHGLIGIILGFLQNLVSFFVSLTDDAVLLYIQFLLLGLKLFLESLNFLLILCNLCTFIFNCDTAFLKGSQDILKRFILLIDLLPGFVNDGRWNTELG